MENIEIYKKCQTVPNEAKKEIKAGRLKGFTDINPMWRIKKLTELFGPCGIGWWYVIKDKYIADGVSEERCAIVDIDLYYKYEDQISHPIPGTGGSMFVAIESKGPRTSDEAFKMALTDAISVSAKALGIGADVYWEKGRDKYSALPEEPEQPATKATADSEPTQVKMNSDGSFTPTCAECGCEISVKVHDFSVEKYKRPLCMKCQKKQNNENR